MATATKPTLVPSPEPKPKSLAAKLAEVVLAVHSVAKRGHNDFHNYDYATAADVLNAVRIELASRHIAVIPRVTAVDVKEKPREGKTPQFIVTTQQVYTLMDGETGEVLEAPWFGCGEDSGDKGIYKALTGGQKYFFQQLFLLPTGDDPEKDTKKRKGPQAPPDAPDVPLDPNSDDAVIVIVSTEIAKITGQHPEDVVKAFSRFVDKQGKERFFTDPRQQRSEKWKHGVREKLERELQKIGAKDAIGDSEPPF